MNFRLFKKRKGTGMLVVRNFSAGTKVNGQLVVGKAVIRPGNTIYCNPKELGEAGIKQCELITQAESAPAAGGAVEKQNAAPPASTLVLKKRDKGGFYDVINPLQPEKPLNDKAMRKEAAEELLKKLTEGEGDPTKVVDETDDGLDNLDFEELLAKTVELGIEPDINWTEAEIVAVLRAHAAGE